MDESLIASIGGTTSRTCRFCKNWFPDETHIGHNVEWTIWYCSKMCYLERGLRFGEVWYWPTDQEDYVPLPCPCTVCTKVAA